MSTRFDPNRGGGEPQGLVAESPFGRGARVVQPTESGDTVCATAAPPSKGAPERVLIPSQYGRGERIVDPIAFVSEEEIRADTAARRAAQERRRIEDFNRAKQSRPVLPKWCSDLLYWCTFVCACSLFAAVCANGFVFLLSLAVMPTYAVWLTGTALALLLVAISYPIVKLLVLFSRLRTKPEISLAPLAVLAERSYWHELVQRETTRARSELMGYVRGYSLEEGRTSILTARSDREDVLGHLTKVRHALLNSREEPERWIKAFRDEFQNELDAAASAAVAHHSKKCAAYTALCAQKPFLDSLIVLYYSLTMFSELLAIYGIRPSWRTTGMIFIRVSMGVFVAGEIDTVVDDVVDHHLNSFSSMVNEDTITASAGEIFGSLLKPVLKSGAQGIVNYALLQRLGKACIRALQPVAPCQK